MPFQKLKIKMFNHIISIFVLPLTPASYYELRYSTDFTKLRTNFSVNPEISEEDILRGNISHIATAGTKEFVVMVLPELENNTDLAYSFAIRAWDKAGNAGDLSSIISVSRFVPYAAPPIITTEQAFTSPGSPTVELFTSPGSPTVEPEGLQTDLIIGLACAGAAFVFIVCIICILLACRHSKQKPKQESEDENVNEVYEQEVQDLDNDKVFYPSTTTMVSAD